ncbi:MAG: hypothetical protein Q4B85_05535 [Lachnospiraceae bacterium]|nr:hypothetical protein [Lachnospiraceae bacterium]
MLNTESLDKIKFIFLFGSDFQKGVLVGLAEAYADVQRKNEEEKNELQNLNV